MLTQKFCVSCGSDLEASLAKRHDQNTQWMASAIAAAKTYAFDDAISLLGRVAEQKDFRFREASESAGKALAKVSAMKAQAGSSAEASIHAAFKASEGGDKAEVARLLSTVPPNLMTESASRLFAQAKAYANAVGELEREFRGAVEQRDWTIAGSLIGQLIETAPEKAEYLNFGKQISQKLLDESQKLFVKQRYEKAVDKLTAIPPVCVSDADKNLRDRILNAQWLSAQFDAEPYATPMLGRLAVKFAKEFSDDKGAQDLVAELSRTLKQSPRPKRMHQPEWKADRLSWVGGNAGILGLPLTIDLAGQPTMRAGAGKFSVAIGLAIQGLGKSRINGVHPPSKKRKKGLLGGFGKKKKAGCWGFDIGNSSLKAVLLESKDDKLVVVDCHYEEFEIPFCRVGFEGDRTAILKSIIEKLNVDNKLDDVSIYANLSASQAVSRFVRLPPVGDKQVTDLMRLEIEQRIPMPSEDLSIVQYVAPLVEDSLYGRAAVVTAAKKLDVDNRFTFFDEIGLNVDSMQSDTVALANFAAYEFADLWKVEEDDDEADDAEKKKKKRRKKIQSLYNNSEEKTPAIALIDCGAASTKFVIVSGETHWAWTIESGSEDLTIALARESKTVHAEAEKLKRNPAAIASPALEYLGVERRQDEIRGRLEKILADAKQQNSRFDVKDCWCVGGGVFAHGWIRRTALSKSEVIP